MSAAADGLGLSARAVRLELDELHKLRPPCVLHWGLNHYVVLKSAGKRRIVIHDPARGKRSVSMAEASKHFTGVAVEFTPTPAFEKKSKPDRVRMWDLWSRMTGFIPSIIQLVLLAAILQMFGLISPLVNQLVVDDAIAKGDLEFLQVVIIGFAIFLLIQTAIGALRSYVGMVFGRLLTFQMRSNLLRHVLRLPADWFEKRHVGDVLSRMGSLGPVQDLFTSAFISILLDGIMAVATLVLMFMYSKTLAGAVIGIVVLSFLTRLATFPYVRRMTEEQIHKDADLQTILLETIRGARAIKIFGREQDRHGLWQNAFTEAMNVGIRVQRFGINAGVVSGLVFGLLDLGVLYMGAREVIGGSLTLGMFFAFQSYRGQFTGKMSALIGQFFAFRMVGLHLERLADIVHTDPEASLDAPLVISSLLKGALEARNIHFRYGDNEPWVLNGVSFAVQPGERIAITGPSGGGKTTLLKLLIGLHNPGEGEVLYDGRGIAAHGIRAIRSQLGVVMQDDRLMSGTLSDNISFFDPEVDMEHVETCAKQAFVHEDIMAMPMGYLSLVGDMGSILSGGQKQRVLLARALYRNPKILFLDEGTANLDQETEASIIAVLETLPITQIIVAHRPAAIAGADRVLVVHGGTCTQV